MAKKAIILIIVLVIVVMAGTIGGLVYFLNKPAEAEVVEEVDEGIDYSTAKLLPIVEKSNVRLQQSGVTPSMLTISLDLIIVDEEAVAQFEPWKSVMMDAALSVLEPKTREEIAGSREALKGPILDAIKSVFPKQEDKDKIIGVVISYFVFQ